MALALPGAEEYSCYGTPAFRVRRKIFARLKEDGASLVVRIDPDEREFVLAASPGACYLTDHYVGHPMMLVRLPVVEEAALADLVEGAWRQAAPVKLVEKLDSVEGES